MANIPNRPSQSDARPEKSTLLNPPSDVPIFKPDDFFFGDIHLLHYQRETIAKFVNARLATFRPAPTSEPDLERMQEALTRAYDKWENSTERGYFSNPHEGHLPAVGAKYLAAEGFLLGNADIAFDMLVAKNEGYKKGIQQTALASETAIQSRIDAAVRVEREEIIAGMEQEITRCQAAIGQASQPENHRQSIFQLRCEIAKIRARTTNSEIAGSTEPDQPAPFSTPSPGTEGDKDPEPKRKVVQIALLAGSNSFVHIVLCDDGTQFAMTNEKTWVELPAIPQPGETP